MVEVRTIAWSIAPCECVYEHRPPVPFCDIHHRDPLGEGGPDIPENQISICRATHDWTHVIFRSFKRENKILPRQTGQPRYAYSLAVRGYNAMLKRRLEETQ